MTMNFEAFRHVDIRAGTITNGEGLLKRAS